MKDKPTIVRVCPPRPDVRGEICVGSVCFQWPDPSIGFKPQVRGWRDPIFPCVMLGGGWGRQLIYEKATQNTYFENEAPVFWMYPETDDYPFAGGEEVCEGFQDRRVRALAIKYNQMINVGIIEGPGVEIPASSWRMNDLYMTPDEDAVSRSYYMTNTGAQPPGVTIAKVYQANNKQTFNDYLDDFQEDGWTGAWVRPNGALWTDPEYFVTDLLS